ncbi:MAG TPA: hypothetical protein VFW00_07760, partial [Rhodocyclaceae bacterium]|nr:hypothetical protein [Rhodocyclaceae bacterium]
MPSVCVLPGLIWPSAEAAEALRGIALPGFATLLGHASLQQSPAISLESWLAEQFGLSSKPPFAALRLAGENNFLGDTPPALDASENWLCADPVALQFSRQHLLLSDPATLDIQNDEALSIISALNETFADVGHFYAASMTRWYLRTSADIDVHFHALAQVIGRSVAHFQPEGRKQAFWAQVGNELQVFCHNHPVNTAREAAGKPPLNAIWLWGAGRLPV